MIVGGGGTGIGILLYEEPRTLTVELSNGTFEETGTRDFIAERMLARTETILDNLKLSLKEKRTEQAKAQHSDGEALLAEELLINSAPDELKMKSDASLPLLLRAESLRSSFDNLVDDLARLEQWQKAQNVFQAIIADMNKLVDLSDEDLDRLDQRRLDFINNPLQRPGPALDGDVG